MTTRAKVYSAIDSERDYQTSKWGEPDHEIDAFALYVAAYTNKLIEVAGTTADDVEKLNLMRKIAGLCVACMEQHGAPLRAY